MHLNAGADGQHWSWRWLGGQHPSGSRSPLAEAVAPDIDRQRPPAAGTRTPTSSPRPRKAYRQPSSPSAARSTRRLLHVCARRVSVKLTAGKHLLRAQAVDPAGRRSPVTRVAITALAPPPLLPVRTDWTMTVPDCDGRRRPVRRRRAPRTGPSSATDAAGGRVAVYDHGRQVPPPVRLARQGGRPARLRRQPGRRGCRRRLVGDRRRPAHGSRLCRRPAPRAALRRPGDVPARLGERGDG